MQVEVRIVRYDEVSRTVSIMNNNTSSGEDLITAEMLKPVQGEIGIDKIHEVLQKVWHSEMCPDDWKRGTNIK